VAHGAHERNTRLALRERPWNALGAVFAVAGITLTLVITIAYFAGGDFPQGWASTVIVVLVSSGAILFALGMIAEYVGVTVNRALGKLLYLIGEDSRLGPLGRPLTQPLDPVDYQLCMAIARRVQLPPLAENAVDEGGSADCAGPRRGRRILRPPLPTAIHCSCRGCSCV